MANNLADQDRLKLLNEYTKKLRQREGGEAMIPFAPEEPSFSAEIPMPQEEQPQPQMQIDQPQAPMPEPMQAPAPEAAPVDERAEALSRYKQSVEDYRKEMNAPRREMGFADVLPDALAGLHNIINYSKGSLQPNIELGYAAKMRTREDALKEDKLNKMKNLSSMFKTQHDMTKPAGKIMSDVDQARADLYRAQKTAVENKPVKKSVGQESVDRDYAKHYNKFTGGGSNKALSGISNLEKLAEELEADAGIGEASGGRFAAVMPDVLRSSDAIRRRDSAINEANKVLKEVFGAQLSDAEREANARAYYNDKLGASENAKLLRQKVKELKSDFSSEMDKARHFEKQGTLENLGATTRSEVQGPSKIRVSNGKETLEIDSSDEQEAAQDGYKRI